MARLTLCCIVAVIVATPGCTRFRKKIQDPIPKSTKKSEPQQIDVPRTSGATAVDKEPSASPVPTAEAVVPCESFNRLPGPPPVGVGKPPFVVTRVLKLCNTSEGVAGYEPQSPYLAMGFPCSGGGGETVIKGNTWDPKLVSFRLSIGCPMNPRDAAAVSQILQRNFGVFQAAKLVAYTPFEIQYWELSGFGDADVGSVVELRTTEGLKKGWEAFQKKEPVSVVLYGRESSWIKGGKTIAADGKILMESLNRFKLEIDQVRVLNDTEYQAVKQKCQALQPRRDCAEAFVE
jgi:hypothetical protein